MFTYNVFSILLLSIPECYLWLAYVYYTSKCGYTLFILLSIVCISLNILRRTFFVYYTKYDYLHLAITFLTFTSSQIGLLSVFNDWCEIQTISILFCTIMMTICNVLECIFYTRKSDTIIPFHQV